MGMADSGLSVRELITIAAIVGFDDVKALRPLLNELEELSDEGIEHRIDEFVRQYSEPK
jgi:hypothetical protein